MTITNGSIVQSSGMADSRRIHTARRMSLEPAGRPRVVVEQAHLEQARLHAPLD